MTAPFRVEPKDPRVRALLAARPDAGWRAILWGELSEMHPVDLLGMLHQSRRTGLLIATVGGTERVVALADGALTWACSTEPEEGEDPGRVVYGLLQGALGTFAFLRAPKDALPAGEPLDTQGLMLDALRRLDETSRASG